jgi:Tfp pilus assembly protein PilN
MLNINFVPDDYIENKESCRTNLLYSVLFLIVMSALAAVFFVTKARNERLIAQEEAIDKQLSAKSQTLEKVKKLEEQSDKLLNKALTVSGLIEPVPRSVLLAMLTNKLPNGVSLLQISLNQNTKEVVSASGKGGKSGEKEQKLSTETVEITEVDLHGKAVNDLQVAQYIQELKSSRILGEVKLIESIEYKEDEEKFRAFRLEVNVKDSVKIEENDIKRIAAEKSLSI